jgi:hypothetical protein
MNEFSRKEVLLAFLLLLSAFLLWWFWVIYIAFVERRT